MKRLSPIAILPAAALLFVCATDASAQGRLFDRIRGQRPEIVRDSPANFSSRERTVEAAEEEGEERGRMPSASARPVLGRATAGGAPPLPEASARPAGSPATAPPVGSAIAEDASGARSRRAGESTPEGEAPSVAEAVPDRTPLGVDVSALRLIPHQDEADAGSSPGVEKIEIHPDVAAPAGLDGILEGYLGEPLSMALLAEISASIIEAWRESDFPIVDVYLPEQNITGGRIQVVVREAVLGAVETEGARHSDPEYLKRNIRLDPGDRIDRRILEADLDWLNLNPIRRVNLIYDRGQLDGTSDILLETTEENPVTAYAGFGNTGLALTGENEWVAGVNWANPFRTEQSFGYHFSGDAELENIASHAFFYRGFLPWRHEMRLIGAYLETDTQSDLGNNLLFDTGGEAIQATAEYHVPLARPAEARHVRHTLIGAFDYKSTNTDVLFGGVNVFASQIEVFQFRGEYEASWRDPLGATRVTVGSVWSPGGVLPNNDDNSFDEQRAGSTAAYWYGFARLERGFDLPGDYQLVLRGTGQISGDRLASTEQIIAGGYLSVRGFEENLVRGDSGGILNAEIHSPPFSLLGVLPGEFPARDKWNLLAFYDGAYLDVSDPLAGEISPSLQSVGLGLGGQFGDDAVLRAAYGWVLDSYGLPGDEIGGGRFHFGMTLRR